MPPAARDWAALPTDILFAVFMELGPYEIMMNGADCVCTSWRRVAASEPALWRRIDMTVISLRSPKGRAMLRTTMERSAGQCEAFSASDCDIASLCFLVERAPSLKSLRLLDCEEMNVGGAIREKLPLLEHLEVSLTHSKPSGFRLFKSICEACPHLKKLSVRFCKSSSSSFFQNHGIHGVKNGPIPMMPELQSLQIYCSGLTKKKLMAIIDNCPTLECLHISPNVNAKKVDKLQARYPSLKILSATYY